MHRPTRLHDVMLAMLLAAATLPAAGAVLAADPIPVGPEFQVNSYATFNQLYPVPMIDSMGNFVIVWDSALQDGEGAGVFMRRFDSAGAALSGDLQVNTYTFYYQTLPAISGDDDGNFVVAWNSFNQVDPNSFYDIFGQTFDSSGMPVGNEFQVNTEANDYQRIPALSMNGSGDFVIVWDSFYQDGDASGIFGQRYDSSGSPAGGEFQVSEWTTGFQGFPRVATHSDGSFVVVWDDYGRDGSYYGIFGRRFDSVGQPVGPSFLVNTTTTDYQRLPSISMDDSGNFVVVWDDYGQDGDGYGVVGQLYDSTGMKIGSEFIVNTYTTDWQRIPDVAMDDAGNFVVVWESRDQDGDLYGVFGQFFDSTAQPVGLEFKVNTYTTDNQEYPRVSMNGSSDFLVVWESNLQDGSGDGIRGQRFILGSLMITSPLDGGSVDCSDPATSVPTITWDTGRFERFRVWVGSDPGFVKGTRIKSWKGFKPVTSWTPSKKKWKIACKKALTADPNMPELHIRVEGRDDDLPKSDPAKYGFSPTVMVDATF